MNQLLEIIAKATADTLHEEGYQFAGGFWVRDAVSPILSQMEFNNFVVRGASVIIMSLQR